MDKNIRHDHKLLPVFYCSDIWKSWNYAIFKGKLANICVDTLRSFDDFMVVIN